MSLASPSQSAPRFAPELHPSDWEKHPKFPKQTLLLGSHRNFRRLSRLLVEDSATESGRPLPLIEALFSSWQAAMQSHERYEEHKLYPYLTHFYGCDLSELQAGHQALEQLRRDVGVAFDEGNRGLVSDALRAFDRRLHSHLEEEEAMVIPKLLALTEDEFQRFTQRSIRELIPPSES